MTENEFGVIIEDIQSQIQRLAEAMADVPADVRVLKNDLTEVKGDVKVIKAVVKEHEVRFAELEAA